MNTPSIPRRPYWLPVVLLVVLYMLVITRRAWIGDDAFITLRTVDNFVSGHGPVYNVGERVQSYTHPLWMLLLSAFYFFTREPFYTTLFISLVISSLAVLVLVFGLGVDRRGALFALVVLTLSNAYVDYSTSGLENGLTHLLLITFLAVFLRAASSPRKLWALSFIAALGVVNRMDTGLLFLPALLYEFWRTPATWRQRLVLGAAGMAPFLLWELFSLIYYGFLVPNTAVAKLNIDVPTTALWQQGAIYLLESLRFDPITLLVILVGMVAAVWGRQLRGLIIAAGALLYLVYLVNIGGDFMSGRFLTAPLLCMVVVIALQRLDQLSTEAAAIALAGVVAVGLFSPWPTLRSTHLTDATAPTIEASLVANERLNYIDNNLVFASQFKPLPGVAMRYDGIVRRLDQQAVEIWRPVGMRGYYAGPNVHVIDYFALVDPLLARLPPIYRLIWRVGHFERVLPEGYLETLAEGENLIADPALAELHDHLTVVTRGSLWSVERWREIWRLNTGYYDDLVDSDAYRFPGMVRVDASAVRAFQAHRAPTDGPGITRFTGDGLEITLSEGRSFARQLDITLDGGGRYRLMFLDGSAPRGWVNLLDPGARFVGQLVLLHARVPRDAARNGFDRVRVIPFIPGEEHWFGHLHLSGPEEWPECAMSDACTVPFNDDRIRSLLHEGWSTPESWGVWSEGPGSSLHLYLKRGDYRLTVQAFPFQGDEGCDQSLTVWFNETLIDQRAFTSCEQGALTFDLVGAIDGVNNLRFAYTRTAEPGQTTIGDDQRRLGVGFVELHLAPLPSD